MLAGQGPIGCQEAVSPARGENACRAKYASNRASVGFVPSRFGRVCVDHSYCRACRSLLLSDFMPSLSNWANPVAERTIAPRKVTAAIRMTLVRNLHTDVVRRLLVMSLHSPI